MTTIVTPTTPALVLARGTAGAISNDDRALLEGVRINVLSKYQDGDGAPTINSKTTKNVAPASTRAYLAAIVVAAVTSRVVLFYPPAEKYGVQAYSWKEAQSWNLATSPTWGVTLEGSGRASIIICDSQGGTVVTDKLFIAGGGPASMSCLLNIVNMFWMGDRTGTPASPVVDCHALIRATLDISVSIVGCNFYGLLTDDEALINVPGMDTYVGKTYVQGCGNTTGVASRGTIFRTCAGIIGSIFEQTYFYPSEHNEDPFGDAPFEKATTRPAYCVKLSGDAVTNSPRAWFRQVVFGGNGNLGGVCVDPGVNYVQEARFTQCTARDNCQRMVHAIQNVREVIVESCHFQHNYASVPTIELAASTCEHLRISDTDFNHDQFYIWAKTGQKSVTIERTDRGHYDLTDAKDVDIDSKSTPDSIAGPLQGWGRPIKMSATSSGGASANLVNASGAEITLKDGRAYQVELHVVGARTAGGVVTGGVSRMIYAHATAGAAVLQHSDLIATDRLPAGWGVTVSAPGGLTLRITVNGAAGYDARFFAEVRVKEIGSA